MILVSTQQEFDCQGHEFPQVEECTCDPYPPAITDAVLQALDLHAPEYFTADPNIMKRFKDIVCQYPTAFHLPGTPFGAVRGFEQRIDTAVSIEVVG